MYGQENEMDKYAEELRSDAYNFETDKKWKNTIAGASQLVGQWVRQMNDPDTLTLATGMGGAAFLAGLAGPQALVPEEIVTVPGAFMAGVTAGNAKTNMEIEGGLAYLEMLENGVSEETAKTIATGVGVVNAGLEFVQLDELAKAYKVLDKIGADDTLLEIVIKELARRGIDVATEVGQEDLQELVTIEGVQLGSRLDTGERAYSADEVGGRLWDTTKNSLLTFVLTNVPAAGNNIYVQSRAKLSSDGYAKLRSGEMPNDAELRAMGISEPDALGMMAVFEMEKQEAAAEGYDSNQLIGSCGEIPESAREIAQEVQDNNGSPPKGYKGGRIYNNIPKDVGDQKLPEGVNYKEYDIYPYVKGQNRGIERIVIGDDGSVWYTNDHYQTFTQIK